MNRVWLLASLAWLLFVVPIVRAAAPDGTEPQDPLSDAPAPEGRALEAGAAPTPLPVLRDRPDAVGSDDGRAGNDGAPVAAPLPLAEPFRSQAMGVSLRPPAGFKMVRKLGGDEVDFVDEKRNW